MEISDEEYEFLWEQRERALRNKDFKELILLNRELYDETLSRYHESIAWEEYGGKLKLSDEVLRMTNNSLKDSLEALEYLLYEGIVLSFYHPQELNNLEEEK